jgi:hypothetical protein
MSQKQPRFSKPIAFFYLLRLNRTVMVALIAAAAIVVLGAACTMSKDAYNVWRSQ